MTDFKYESISLETSSFRLLRLLKGYDSPILCELFDPKQTPSGYIGEYAALSYTWGGQLKPCEIVINGSKLAVTKNAYLALRDLRYKDKDRVLWIDTLCIDQSNDKEKGLQIQHMGSIYGNAERVLIWLGEATYDINYLMQYMKLLEAESAKLLSDGHKISSKQYVDIWSTITRHITADQNHLLIEGLQSLLHRNWFRRVWIIQETANARKAEVICGSESVTTGIFALMPSLLGVSPMLHCQPILEILPGTHRDSSWYSEKRNLSTMLMKFRKSEATDPRDKIYALFEISSDVSESGLLKADYEKSVKDAIFDTTLFLLNIKDSDGPFDCFLDWTLPQFFRNLNDLPNKVLECAVITGCSAIVKPLIMRNKVDLYREISDQPLLAYAAQKGLEAVVRELADFEDAEVDSKDSTGRTALSYAASSKNEAVVKLLIDRHDVDFHTCDNKGRTPLSYAAEAGHESVLKLLLYQDDIEIDAIDSNGRTPLSFAAWNGHKTVVKLLIDEGAKLNCKDYYGETPLLRAVLAKHEAIIKLLLDRADIEVDLKNNWGRTPLSYAAEVGKLRITRLLIDHGAEVDSGDNKLRTPLEHAAFKGHKAVAKLLIERDADIETDDYENNRPLHMAARSGNDATVELFLDHGAEIDPLNKYLETPLMLAAWLGHEAVVKLLIKRGAKLDCTSAIGYTPISQAIRNGHEETVKLLEQALAIGRQNKPASPESAEDI
jgi:ankyrin repeat protein